MRVADYIFKRLADSGVTHVFMVSGGGAMHLNDALRQEKRIKPICCHHEQACAMAAEGYSRVTGQMAVVCVTSGPGGTNATTGVLGQFTDSIPVLYLSGQVKHETTLDSVPNSGLRQLGDQEADIISIVKPITKYAKMVTDPQSIQHELAKAMLEAVSGRPGPVWLDIPMNVQGAELIDQVEKVAELLLKAKRPLIVAGHGIRIAEAQSQFNHLLGLIGIPAVTTFLGFDLMDSNNPLFAGRIGIQGTTSGNTALRNADLVICIGTRNNIRQISHKWESYARNAIKVIVDIDRAELDKKTVKGDVLIQDGADLFLTRLINKIPKGYRVDSKWVKKCQDNKKKYPVVLESYKKARTGIMHPYHFIEELTKALPNDAIVTAGNGTACVGLFQAGVVKSGQRMFWNSGTASMGYELPAAIGAAFASGKEVFCLAGDGSIQMNLQELQTIVHHNLSIKIFVLNNNGYRSIEITQRGFCNGFIGCNKESGVSFPNLEMIAVAYGIAYSFISSEENLNRIKQIQDYCGPLICEVMVGNDYEFAPKLGSVKLPDGTFITKGYDL